MTLTSLTLLAKGVELRLDVDGDRIVVSGFAFVDVEVDGRPDRWFAGTYFADLDLAAKHDPTGELIDFSDHCGSLQDQLFHELLMEEWDVLPWEYHALPSRVLLDANLRAELRDRWDRREPTFPADGP